MIVTHNNLYSLTGSSSDKFEICLETSPSANPFKPYQLLLKYMLTKSKLSVTNCKDTAPTNILWN